MSQTQIAQVDIDLYLHVRVLISMILGLSVTRLVGGVASLIHPTPHRVSFIHLGWVAWVLLNVLGFWWWEFRLRLIEFFRSAGSAAQDRGPKRGPALFGTQEQVDAESDLVDRAVISVDVAADKESDMP